jgi:hypothetical protein
MYLKWGTVGGRGKGNGEQKGGVSIQQTRDQSGRESHHDAKEGFQASKREGQETRGGDFQVRGVNKRIGACTSNITLILYISC